MNLPGFYAELSLAPTKGNYRTEVVFSRSSTVELTQSLLVPIDKGCTNIYSTYISHYFPVTVCEPLFEFPLEVLREANWSTFNALFTLPIGLSFRSSESHRLGFPVFQKCHVELDPFRAEVATSVECGGDPNHPASVLNVLDHPELSAEWDGGLEDIPAPYNPNWFFWKKEVCISCGGLNGDGGYGGDGDIHPV
jgi:hypothetical protein